MKKYDLTIILPVILWHKYLLNLTITCIRNLRFFTQGYNLQIILINNNHKLLYDEHILTEWLTEDDIYIPNEDNQRLGKCMNDGIKKAESDYIAILANDVMVHENWFKFAKEILDDNLLDFVIPCMDRVVNREWEGDILGWSLADGLGNCCVFKKDIYNQVGPFDENLFVFCDRDYKIRVEELGLKVGTSKKSIATHIGSMTWLDRHQQLENEKAFGFNFWEAEDQDNKYFMKKWGHNT